MAATAANTDEKEDDDNHEANEQEADLEADEERAAEELRARRNQLQGMVDANDFDMEELRLLGVNIDDADDADAGGDTARAFERIFDDDVAAEESKAAMIRHQKTAQLFAASSGFAPLNAVPKVAPDAHLQKSTEGTMDCKDESIDDMLNE